MPDSRKQDDLLGSSAEDDGGFFGDSATAEDPSRLPGEGELRVSEPAHLSGGTDAARQKEGYVVLARKYRPQTFDQIVGQENVQQALRGAIATGQISHAYLFSGPRGTGKTSTARILAKAVNCQEGGPRPDPCGRCSSCRSITAGSSLDVIEIDAASNTGVDNIRELRSGVVLAPFSRFKVYIVDEVHMLSNQAFNALLKTLEEPPPQVIFILATTEIHKVPETIVSRCQSFAFRRFSNNELQGQLGRILDAEVKQRGLEINPEDRDRILELVARNAEGGMRDAQVALDQVLVFSRGTLDFETVRRFLGLAESESLDNFIRAIHGRDIDTLLGMVDEFFASGQDLELFVKNVCEHARDLLIVRTSPNRPELVNVSDDRYAALRQIATELRASFLLNLSSVFLRLAEEMKSSPQPRFALELALLKFTADDPTDDLQSILQRLEVLEKTLAGGSPPPGGGGGEKTAQVGSSVTHGLPNAATDLPPVSRSGPVALSVPVPVSPVEPVRAASLATVVQIAEAEPASTADVSVTMCGTPRTPEELLKCLQDNTINRNHLLHITLLDFARVTHFDGRTATIEVGDAFGHAHLSRPQNQAVLRELAREACGCEVQIKLEMAQQKGVVQTVPVQPPPGDVATPAPMHKPSAPDRVVPSDQQSEPVLTTALPESTRHIAPAPGDASIIEPSSYSVYVSPELRRKAMTEIKGEAFRQLLESRAELKELVDKVKETFGVTDSHFHYRVHGF